MCLKGRCVGLVFFLKGVFPLLSHPDWVKLKRNNRGRSKSRKTGKGTFFWLCTFEQWYILHSGLKSRADQKLCFSKNWHIGNIATSSLSHRNLFVLLLLKKKNQVIFNKLFWFSPFRSISTGKKVTLDCERWFSNFSPVYKVIMFLWKFDFNTILTTVVGSVSYSSSGALNYVYVLWTWGKETTKSFWEPECAGKSKLLFFCQVTINFREYENNAIWIRIAWGTPYTKPNQYKTSYVVYHSQTPYAFISPSVLKSNLPLLCQVRNKTVQTLTSSQSCRARIVLAFKRMRKDLSLNVTY